MDKKAFLVLFATLMLMSASVSAFSFQDIIDYILSLFVSTPPVVKETCPQGYIPAGELCCKDHDGNNICDAYETSTTQPRPPAAVTLPTTSTSSSTVKPAAPTTTSASTTVTQPAPVSSTIRTTTTSARPRPTLTTGGSNGPSETTTTQERPGGYVCGNGVFEPGEECESASDCGDEFHRCVGCRCVTDCSAFCGGRGQGYSNHKGIGSTEECLAKAAEIRGPNEDCVFKCSKALFLEGLSETCCCVKVSTLPCMDCPCTGAGCTVKCPTESECEVKL